MKKIAFICVHNSCRSQIAEALGRHFASDVFESYSAGTQVKPQINQDAVRLVKEIYGIDMEAAGQHSKLISDIPKVDIAISMGCNVSCPFIGRVNCSQDLFHTKCPDIIRGAANILDELLAEYEKR